jgi:hypothetical protein
MITTIKIRQTIYEVDNPRLATQLNKCKTEKTADRIMAKAAKKARRKAG